MTPGARTLRSTKRNQDYAASHIDMNRYILLTTRLADGCLGWRVIRLSTATIHPGPCVDISRVALALPLDRLMEQTEWVGYSYRPSICSWMT